MLLRRFLGFALGLGLLAGQAMADGPEDVIRAKLKLAFPTAVVTAIKPTPVPGFYEVDSQNYENIYISADGRFMLQGDLLEIRGSQIVNISDEAMSAQRKVALAKVDRKDMIVFPAAGNKPKAAVYVFTDVDCGYCRKMHTEVPKLNKMGIEVRYLAFPRTGPKSNAAAKMDKVWCAVDRNSALTDAKKGGSNTGAQKAGCKSPVAEQFALGVALGVKGTPSVFLEDGTQVGGYVAADELAGDLKVK